MQVANVLISLVLCGTVCVLASARVLIASDHRRIRAHFEKQDFTVRFLKWRPFQRGDLGEQLLRTYDVICEDTTGNGHHFLVSVVWIVAPELRIEEIG